MIHKIKYTIFVSLMTLSQSMGEGIWTPITMDKITSFVPYRYPTHITPYYFVDNRGDQNLENDDRLKKMKIMLGDGKGHKLSEFYSEEDLNEGVIHRDFRISENVIMTCDKRNEEFIKKNSTLKGYANAYFKNKKVFLNYCLDLGDTLDWIALQGAILNADYNKKVSLGIPANKTFVINQVLSIKPNTRIVWMTDNSSKTLISIKGQQGQRPGASFIKFLPNKEPVIDKFKDPVRQTNYSTGSVIITSTIKDGFLPYSGPSIGKSGAVSACEKKRTAPLNYTGQCEDAIAKNIHLLYPHIDGNNALGENGFSAGALSDINIWGGTIKNIKINPDDNASHPAYAGGKAIQCEAGCKEFKINGLYIVDAYIGINSNVIDAGSKVSPFEKNDFVSQIHVNGLYMKNVKLPINVYNEIDESKPDYQSSLQDVEIRNFTILNSKDNGLGMVKSLNGKNIVLKNGEYYTESGCINMTIPLSGFTHPEIEDVLYSSHCNDDMRVHYCMDDNSC